MQPLRLILRIALCAFLLLGIAGSATAAGPDDVLRDYSADGVIDGSYSVQELSAALSLARRQGEALYADVASAIDAARSETLAGGTEPSSVPVKGGPAASGGRDASGISAQEIAPQVPSAWPTPPVVQPGSDVPLPFVVLSGLAVVLAAAGAVSAVYRRLTR